MFTRVRGNTIKFAMPLQGKIFYAGGIAITDFVPLDTDIITVVMQDRKAFTYTPTYEDGMLLWTDDGELEVGVYSVEVLVERESGAHLRCIRINQVNIVETNDESELDTPFVNPFTPDTAEGESVGADAQETEQNTVSSNEEETQGRSVPTSDETVLNETAQGELRELRSAHEYYSEVFLIHYKKLLCGEFKQYVTV